MGDRCYLALYIHGHIEHVAHLQTIVTAIEEEGMSTHYDGGQQRPLSVLEAFAVSAIKMHDTPEFYMDECNYADITEVENTLRLYNVAYHIDHGAGIEYPAGASSWMRERGLHAVDTTGGDAVLDLTTIERAMNEGNLEEIIKEARWANGADLPEFSVSDEVMSMLAKVLAVKAHNVQNVTAEMIFSNPGDWMK